MSHSARLSDYRAVLTTRGARGPVLASLAARLPIAMVGFAVLLHVHDRTSSFAVAGTVAAGMLVGVAVGSVGQGRVIDRLGPTRPLLALTAVFAVAVTALVVGVERGVSTPVLTTLAAAAGLSQPMVASASRSLWGRLLPHGPLREAAYAYEAISMEVFFILGPGAAGLLMAAPWPGTGVVAGAAVMVAGTVAFALSPAVRAWRAREGGGDPAPGALSSPGMRTVCLAALGFGVVIGFVEVAAPAAATAAGHATLGGLLLSIWSLSSVLVGTVYGARPWPSAMTVRVPALLGAFGVLVGLLALPTWLAPASMALLAGVMVLAGALITPQATAHSSILEVVAPRGTATEAFGWVITSVMLGAAAGQSLSGVLVETFGPPVSFLSATVGGVLLAAVVFARRSSLTGAPPARSLERAEVLQLSSDAVLGRRPESGVHVGVDELDDLARACLRP